MISAEPRHRFSWAVLTGTSGPDVSVWSFEIEPDQDGSTLTQRYMMRRAPELFRSFIDGVGPEIVEMRKSMLENAMKQTVAGIKKAVEQR